MRAFWGKFFKVSGSLVALLGVLGVLINIISSLFSTPRVHPTAGNGDLFLYIIGIGFIFIGVGVVISKLKSPHQ